MARVKVEQHICDICGKEGYQRKCVLCGREFCILCRQTTCFNNELCGECEKRDDYKEIFKGFREKFIGLAKLELKALMRLPKYKPKLCPECDIAHPKLIRFQFQGRILKRCAKCRENYRGGAR